MAIETEMFRLLFLCHGKGVKLLGKGKGGYSYLAESGNNRYVLKQIHHEPCDYYQFGNKLEAEIRDYKKLKEIGIKMPAMLETDVKNERILKEFIDGDTIYQLICCSKQ
jgi:TP53 regulating kinase-like protein